MAKIIDAENSVVGRIASFAAKEALKGEEVVIVNCEKAIISGRKEDIKGRFDERRKRVGTLQVGPKMSILSEKYFKKIIRGMLPDHRGGRGKEALKRVMCYKGVPEKFKDAKKVEMFRERKIKFMRVQDLTR